MNDYSAQWNEPSVVYMDDLHPLVAEEKAQAVAVSAVAAAIAKVLTAAVACSCTSTSSYAKFARKDEMRSRMLGKALCQVGGGSGGVGGGRDV